MTIQVTDENGQIHLFPDDASEDEMNEILNSSSKPEGQLGTYIQPKKEVTVPQMINAMQPFIAPENTPLNKLLYGAENYGAGAVEGTQNIYNNMRDALVNVLEPLGFPQSKSLPVMNRDPYEYMGIQKEPADDESASALQSLGRGTPGFAIGAELGLGNVAGNLKNVGNMINAGVGGLTSELGEKEPNLSDAINNSLMSMIIPGAFAGYEGAKGLFSYDPAKKLAGSVARYINPESDRLPTQAENIQELSKRAQFAANSRKQEALGIKKELFDNYGQNTIDNTDELPEGDYLTRYKREAQAEGYEKTPAQKQNVNDFYDDKLQSLHDEYSSKPTLNNSDALIRELNQKINKIYSRQKPGTPISGDDQIKLDHYEGNREALLNDQQRFFDSLPESDKNAYAEYRKKYSEYKRNYDYSKSGNANLIRLAKGDLSKITPKSISNAMRYPELRPQVQNIINDIGPSGIKNIAMNELSSIPKDNPNAFAAKIDELIDQKGFGRYLTPEFRSQLQSLQREHNLRSSVSNALKLTGKGGLFLKGGQFINDLLGM